MNNSKNLILVLMLGLSTIGIVTIRSKFKDFENKEVRFSGVVKDLTQKIFDSPVDGLYGEYKFKFELKAISVTESDAKN